MLRASLRNRSQPGSLVFIRERGGTPFVVWIAAGRSGAQPSPVGPVLEKEGAAVGETLRRKCGRRAQLGRARQ